MPEEKARYTVSFDKTITCAIDEQAEAEKSNRAAIVRKAISFYIKVANGEEPDGTIVMTGPPVVISEAEIPGPRVTIQLPPESAAEADSQAAREETTRGSLARKAAKYYICMANGQPLDDMQIVMLPLPETSPIQ